MLSGSDILLCSFALGHRSHGRSCMLKRCGCVLESLCSGYSYSSSFVQLDGNALRPGRCVWASSKESPGRWKSWIRKSRHTVLLEERWCAEVQMLDGLIPRLLLKLGACHSPFVQPGTPTVEVCAVCRQGFKDLRSCSHHAFKRHGRIRPERRLADGCQCPVCLKTCAANGRLCNHLRHNRSCRDALAGRHGTSKLLSTCFALILLTGLPLMLLLVWPVPAPSEMHPLSSPGLSIVMSGCLLGMASRLRSLLSFQRF